MTYIGMVIDGSVAEDRRETISSVFRPGKFWWGQMMERAWAIGTWPGQKIADNLFCVVC